jgi:hypothetical protein
MSSLSRYEKDPKIIKQWMSGFADQMVWPEWQKTLITKFVDTQVVVDYGDVVGPKKFTSKFDILATRIKWQQEVIDHVSFKGHWMEFGVREGNSLGWVLDKIPDQVMHGFDSWEGLPESWNVGTEEFKQGSMAVPMPSFPNNQVHLWKGWFDDTIDPWKEKHLGDIAYLHIDSDLYSSAKTVLTKLNDRIVPGTLIVFDELANFRLSGKMKFWWQHEWKALCEWLKENDREVSPVLRSPMYQAAIKVIV